MPSAPLCDASDTCPARDDWGKRCIQPHGGIEFRTPMQLGPTMRIRSPAPG
jgi:hypothetical protein